MSDFHKERVMDPATIFRLLHGKFTDTTIAKGFFVDRNYSTSARAVHADLPESRPRTENPEIWGRGAFYIA